MCCCFSKKSRINEPEDYFEDDEAASGDQKTCPLEHSSSRGFILAKTQYKITKLPLGFIPLSIMQIIASSMSQADENIHLSRGKWIFLNYFVNFFQKRNNYSKFRRKSVIIIVITESGKSLDIRFGKSISSMRKPSFLYLMCPCTFQEVSRLTILYLTIFHYFFGVNNKFGLPVLPRFYRDSDFP